jgi:hypothetical protein
MEDSINLSKLEFERNCFLLAEEENWRQKSRAIWIKSGDRNTKFFHLYASHRRNKKFIWEINDEKGKVHSGQQAIKEEAVRHFSSFFNDTGQTFMEERLESVRLYPTFVTALEVQDLEKEVTKDEVFEVIKGFARDKILDLDGWTVEFYHCFFELVGQDLVDMVEETRLKGEIIPSINSTFVALIPKVNKPTVFNDFRPISLCNLCYKIISKIIAKRLRPILSRVLSEEQLGFLKGRKILDAIGTAQECLHNIRTKKMQALILKLDLRKAYDCTSWDFLRLVLHQSGFGLKTTNWIMACVSSTTYATLINKEATNFFKCSKGLRQGCPLSPLLFILVMEGLSLALKKAKSDGQITGIKVSSLIRILHLLFVDDILIMTKASLAEWEKIQSILQVFCRASGLIINNQKSIVLHAGVDTGSLQRIVDVLGYSVKDLNCGFKYLGYLMKPGSYKTMDWQWLVDRFETRINHWCNKWLTLGGRLILIKVVLESLPVYWMTLAHISVTVLTKLRRLSYDFLWAGNKTKKCYHLCNWQIIAKPKQLGGWGLRNIFIFYRALATNTLWRALMKPRIWQRVIKEKYLPHVPVSTWLRSAESFTPLDHNLGKIF